MLHSKDEQQNLFISRIEPYIKENNIPGNEENIIKRGYNIDNQDLSTQIKYIELLCHSEYPITAAMTLERLFHDEVSILKEIVYKNIKELDWSLHYKILSLLFINKYEEIIEFIDKENNKYDVKKQLGKTIDFLTNNSKYEYFFELFNAVARCKYGDYLYKLFTKLDIQETKQYLIRNLDRVKEGVQALYNRKNFDAVFYVCKNFDLFHLLKEILDKNAEELKSELLELNTMNGTRLTFRVLQNELSDDEKAYKIIISKIKDLEKTDEIQYILFYYLIKLIKYKKAISVDIKDELEKIGEVKNLKRNSHGILELADTLEIILINSGMEAYNEFVQILGPNNIFIYEENEIPETVPFVVYNNRSRKNTLVKETAKKIGNLKIIREKNKLGYKDFYKFYLNSFYRFLVPINDFFTLLFENEYRNDRVQLKRYLDSYKFNGKVSFVNREKAYGIAYFQNIIYTNTISLNERNIGKVYFDLLEKGDTFTIEPERFDPIKKYIGINEFSFLEDSKKQKYEEKRDFYFNIFKDCLDNIMVKGKLDNEDINQINSIPSIDIKKTKKEDNEISILREKKLANDFTNEYSKVLLSLSDKPKELISFIKLLDRSNNNLFNIFDNDSNFLPVNRESKDLKDRANETIDSLKNNKVKINELIWIYLNSYLRLVIDIQDIFDYIMKLEGQIMDIGPEFYGYRFFGNIKNETAIDKNGRKIGFVDSWSTNSRKKGISEEFYFYIDSEQNVTQDIINKTKLVTFRLNKYNKETGYIEIADLWVQDKKFWSRNWGEIYSASEQIKFIGSATEEILRNLRNLSRLDLNRLDIKVFLDGFTWCLNNLSKNKNELFEYIESLHENNPFKYSPGENKLDYIKEIEGFNNEEGIKIINNLLENSYGIYSIVYIYLNSFLPAFIPIDYIFEAYYNKESDKKPGIRYFIKVVEIELVATIKEIIDNKAILKLNNIDSESKIILEIDHKENEKESFKIGQTVSISLIYFDQSNYTIGAEIRY